MSYIVVIQNPRTSKLSFLLDDDGDPCQFSTEVEAWQAAAQSIVCREWYHEVVQIPFEVPR